MRLHEALVNAANLVSPVDDSGAFSECPVDLTVNEPLGSGRIVRSLDGRASGEVRAVPAGLVPSLIGGNHDRSTGSHRRPYVRQRGQRLVLDVDEGGAVRGVGFCLADDGRHRLPRVLDPSRG